VGTNDNNVLLQAHFSRGAEILISAPAAPMPWRPVVGVYCGRCLSSGAHHHDAERQADLPMCSRRWRNSSVICYSKGQSRAEVCPPARPCRGPMRSAATKSQIKLTPSDRGLGNGRIAATPA
jgi:hypothetical protein